MSNTKKMKIIIVEGISDLQFLDFLTSNYCKPFCIKPLSKTEQENPIFQGIPKDIKNIYSCQEKSLIALDFNGQENITESKINNVLNKINEKNPGLECELLIIFDNDTNPAQTAKQINTTIEKLQKKATDNEQDKYQLKSIQTLALPNETSAGCLENLIINILPEKSLQCFNGLISCLENSTQLLPNENTIAKLKLNYYNTFFTQQGKTDIKTSIENILKNTQKQYGKEEKDFLSYIQQNPDIKNIIDKLSIFIDKTLDVNHPPLEGG